MTVPDADGVPETGLPVRPVPDGSDIRKVTEADIPQVAEALAKAFCDDPIFSWLVPDESSRMGKLERAFGLYLRRVWFTHNECLTTDRLIGGAMWMPPDTWHMSVLEQLRLLPALVATVGRDLPRLITLLNAIEKKHPHDAHYYLPVIGVEPEWQGRGFGAALMRPVLERCDRERLPAYLEATSPRNRAAYERHGFQVVDELTVRDSPPLWPMRREPQG